MALNCISNDSKYFTSLNYSSRKQYLEKLKINGQVLKDPYSIDEVNWSKDMTQWPELQFGDVYTNLINTEGQFTKEKLKAYKSLDAYNYFYNGYVRTVFFCHSGDFSTLKARVIPSQRAPENSHKAWVIISMKDGSVQTAHCTCMAR